MSAPLHIFYSYAPEDEELLQRLDRQRHLSEEALLVSSEADLTIHMEKTTNSLEIDGCWKVQASLNGQNDLPPMEERLKFIKDMRKVPENRPSHWCHLPWELWFRNQDFLRCAKELEIFWSQPQPSKINWLHTMLLMTRIPPATTTVPASNRNVQSTNQQNNGNVQAANQQNNGTLQATP